VEKYVNFVDERYSLRKYRQSVVSFGGIFFAFKMIKSTSKCI